MIKLKEIFSKEKINLLKNNSKEFMGKLFKKFKEMSLKKKAIVILIIVLAIYGIIKLCAFLLPNNDNFIINKCSVVRKDIEVLLSGSSTVEPVKQFDVVSTVRGDILEDYIEVGKEVKEGDLLYVIDSSDAVKNVSKAELSYDKSLLTYNQNQESLNNLNIKSPIEGVITKLSVKEGDNVNNNTNIGTIIDYSKLEVKLPFLKEDAQNIKAYDNAEVSISMSGLKTTGTVKSVNTGSYVGSTGAFVSDVTIEFDNPGALKTGTIVTAKVNGYACNNEGEASYTNTYNIIAKTSGEIKKLYLSEGDKVGKGQVIGTIENDSVAVNAKSSNLSLQDSKLSVDDAYEALEDYNIKSTIDGIVISKTYKAGDTIDGSDKMQTLAVVADVSKLVFTLNIDELDISKVEVGQEVRVTADAVSGKTFKGVVKTKSIMGTTTYGTTSYPVEVEISEYEDLIPGMSINAEIIVEQAKQVLSLPLAAIQRGNRVLVKNEYVNKNSSNKDKNISRDNGNFDSEKLEEMKKNRKENNEEIKGDNIHSGEMAIDSEKFEKFKNKNSGDEKNNVDRKKDNKSKGKENKFFNMESDIAGYTYVEVELGASDDNFVEIISGLNEGDEVCYKTVKNGKDTAAAASTQGGFGMPGMGSGMNGRTGGMPTGGMPTGGKPSGGMSGGGMPTGGKPSGGMSGGGMPK